MHNCTTAAIEVNLPRTLTEDSQNEIISSGHSHEVEKASTSKAGIVKLNDTLVSLSKVEALTANQGRELAERIEEVLSASKVGSINKTLDAALAILATRYTYAYATYQAARDNVARHPENALIYVVNDPQMSFNGLWTVVGGKLVKAPWDALSSALTSEPFEVLQAIFQGAAGEKIEYEGKTYDTLATFTQTLAEGKAYIQTVLADLAQSNNFTASYLLTESGKFQEEINNETVKFVESIAELLAIQNPKDGQVVFVKSYYAGLNKGYGAFYYNGTDWVRISNKESLEGYGLHGDGITNDQAAIASGQAAEVPLTIESKEVYAPVFLANFNCNLDGNNTTVYVNSSLGMSVSVQIRPNSRLSNIKFDNSRAGSYSWSYAGIGNNVYLKNVGFYGFRDDVLVCSWGILFTEVKDVTLDNCHFGNNSQSDIAFTDNVENITIINAKNEAEGGVSLNFEPNDTRYCRNVQVIGGTYRLVQILENNYLSTSIQGLSFTGALIKDLIYDGGDVVFTNTIIEKIRNEIIGGDSWAGSMRSDSINISPNLVKDPYFLDAAALNEPDKYWGVFDPIGNNSYAYKYNARDGRYLQLNQNEVGNEVGLQTPLIYTNGASTMLLACSMRGAGSNLSSSNVWIYFHDSSGSQVGEPLKVITVRGDAQNKLNWKNTVLFFDVPDGASKIKLYVRNQPTASVCIRSIGLYNYALLKDGTGNFNTSLDTELYKPLNVNQASHVQSFTQYGSRPTPMTGDKVVINTLASGATRELMFNGTDWVSTLKNNTY